MNNNIGDIDIDVADRASVLSNLNHVPAILYQKGKRKSHPTGVYFQDIPKDPYDGLSNLLVDDAQNKGFFKFDILNVSLYRSVKSNEHLDELVKKEPNWELLNDRRVVESLYHISKYYDQLQINFPRSVEQLAMFIAMIRPSKRYLFGRTWDQIEEEIWERDGRNKEFVFKKSHSIAYSLLICVQLNLIEESSIMN